MALACILEPGRAFQPVPVSGEGSGVEVRPSHLSREDMVELEGYPRVCKRLFHVLPPTSELHGL